DAIRRDRHKQELENAQPVLEIGYQPNFDVKEIINHAVDQLPTVQKSVLLLRDYEGYSYGEIAGITGLNESQVKVYIYRARVFLKEKLVSIENLI
ncbi:MAG TPA: RNA polymerase sigma factor, partial [Tenuifilaceae bacterium]|nr:RNA polymerase sigma factor [Tenuifilaceae bacterium]